MIRRLAGKEGVCYQVYNSPACLGSTRASLVLEQRHISLDLSDMELSWRWSLLTDINTVFGTRCWNKVWCSNKETKTVFDDSEDFCTVRQGGFISTLIKS